jgi:hypothetical protein
VHDYINKPNFLAIVWHLMKGLILLGENLVNYNDVRYGFCSNLLLDNEYFFFLYHFLSYFDKNTHTYRMPSMELQGWQKCIE